MKTEKPRSGGDNQITVIPKRIIAANVQRPIVTFYPVDVYLVFLSGSRRLQRMVIRGYSIKTRNKILIKLT